MPSSVHRPSSGGIVEKMLSTAVGHVMHRWMGAWMDGSFDGFVDG